MEINKEQIEPKVGRNQSLFSSILRRNIWKICLQIGVIWIQRKYGRDESAYEEKLARVDEA